MWHKSFIYVYELTPKKGEFWLKLAHGHEDFSFCFSILARTTARRETAEAAAPHSCRWCQNTILRGHSYSLFHSSGSERRGKLDSQQASESNQQMVFHQQTQLQTQGFKFGFDQSHRTFNTCPLLWGGATFEASFIVTLRSLSGKGVISSFDSGIDGSK